MARLGHRTWRLHPMGYGVAGPFRPPRAGLHEGLSRFHLVEGNGKEPMRRLAALHKPEGGWPTRIGLPGDLDGHSGPLLSRDRRLPKSAAVLRGAVNPPPVGLLFPTPALLT